MAHIIVDAVHAPMGCMLLTPRNTRLQRRIVEYFEKLGQKTDASVFVQSEDEIEAWLSMTPAKARRDFDAGWNVSFKIDPWEFLHAYGWDAHEGVRW